MSIIYSHPRSSVILVKRSGSAIPYNGNALPEILKYPLVKSEKKKADCGDIAGFNSGNRSAIVYDGRGAIYKLKGCALGGGSWNTQPYGGMSQDKCSNELDSNAEIAEIYAEFGVIPPLIPEGHYAYDDKFDGGNISCAIMKSSGDTRFNEFRKQVFIHPELCTPEYLDELYSGISSWMGFSQGVLKRAKIAPSVGSNDIVNYVLHWTGNGFGMGRVDFASAPHGIESFQPLKIKEEFDLRNIRTFSMDIAIYESAKDSGVTFENISKGFSQGKTIRFSETNGKERRVANKHGIVFRVNPSRFERVKKAEELYRYYARCPEAPEPISAELVNPLFS